MEDASTTCRPDLKSFKDTRKEADQPSKRRKVVEKTVVTVKINEESVGKQKGEGPPSDFWSWRKYGQKPIKGSPYPRGYYKCSTSKGCSAKKQVERCRTDATMLIITYTSSHNHPGPSSCVHTKPTQPPQQIKPLENPLNTQQQQQQEEQQPITTSDQQDQDPNIDSNFQFQSPINSSSDDFHEEQPLTVLLDKSSHEPMNLLFDEEEPLSYPHIMTFSSSSKSEDNDFFDELEELPISSSSSFTSLIRNSFFDERILA